jgi:DNA invertase Pin-like site-specific DNA recombinase
MSPVRSRQNRHLIQRSRGADPVAPVRKVRCAIYTRKSSEEGLDMDFNSLDAQRESCEAYITSQKAEGWLLVADRYDDGGFSGGTMERPALKRLLADVKSAKVEVIVVYKIDRLSRSMLDFLNLIELFERHGVTFVSVTQSFNTKDAMGRMALNILVTFAQFERELIGERIRDKVAASRKRGKWMGGWPCRRSCRSGSDQYFDARLGSKDRNARIAGSPQKYAAV